jgi:hypothetical protein
MKQLLALFCGLQVCLLIGMHDNTIKKLVVKEGWQQPITIRKNASSENEIAYQGYCLGEFGVIDGTTFTLNTPPHVKTYPHLQTYAEFLLPGLNEIHSEGSGTIYCDIGKDCNKLAITLRKDSVLEIIKPAKIDTLNLYLHDAARYKGGKLTSKKVSALLYENSKAWITYTEALECNMQGGELCYLDADNQRMAACPLICSAKPDNGISFFGPHCKNITNVRTLLYLLFGEKP